MIALPHHLPFIRLGNNSLTICQTDWLEQTLTDAATGTELPEWLAVDISRGVERYLENHYEGTVIDSEVLFDKIGTTLTKMGLSQVAARIDKSPPPLRVSLSELARRAGEGYELAFFQLLDRECRAAIDSEATCVEFHGLRRCVLILNRSRRWCSACDLLLSEIESRLDTFRCYGELANPIFNLEVKP